MKKERRTFYRTLGLSEPQVKEGFEVKASCGLVCWTQAYLSCSRESAIHVEQGDDAGVLGDRHDAERDKEDSGWVSAFVCVVSSLFFSLGTSYPRGTWNKRFAQT